MTQAFPPRRILVPMDFSDCSRAALSYAAQLAQATKATLVALHVGPPVPDFAYPLPETAALQAAAWTETVRHQKEWAQEAMEKELDPWDDHVQTEIAFVEGEPSDSILRACEELDCQLVVMGSHGRMGLRRALMGSVAERTVRHAQVPVLVVR